VPVLRLLRLRPARLVPDRAPSGLRRLLRAPSLLGANSIAIIGLFNIIGAALSGELSGRWRRRELLVFI